MYPCLFQDKYLKIAKFSGMGLEFFMDTSCSYMYLGIQLYDNKN